MTHTYLIACINQILRVPVVFLLLCIASPIWAVTCPSPDEIRERNISEDMEWTVDENTSLEILLSVTDLFAITIENESEFISCKYKIESRFIKLDGIPVQKGCSIVETSGNWFTSGKRKICDEEDLYQCIYDIKC